MHPQTSDQSFENKKSRTGVYKATHRLHPIKDSETAASGFPDSNIPVINISGRNVSSSSAPPSSYPQENDDALADELDYITVNTIDANNAAVRTDKASRILGIKHRRSMEPVPPSARNSMVSTRSLRDTAAVVSHLPTSPLTSLYVVSGLPKSPHTWTLADPDSVLGLHHSESAVNRWWRPEVLGSTISPGAGGGKKRKGRKGEEVMKGAGALSKQEVGKMLSKALKVNPLHKFGSILAI
jgi:hypothetical protein